MPAGMPPAQEVPGATRTRDPKATFARRPLDGAEIPAEMFWLPYLSTATERSSNGERATNRDVTRRGRTYDAPLRARRASA